ncbi:GHKL domain-containing protein [Desulfurispirillum indicum]|uniref:sensor histidine kinase n=1 Tax=Desulfurispirillum indicum TaxID=936456 RepID=UPI001CFA2B7D|nr:ATP-binding protein [Desulfurispirillum indicum]UCZ57091.1 GHKL domain-containing protein [Desulfurispirillum indicum]
MDKNLKVNLIVFYILFTLVILATVWLSLQFIVGIIAEKSVDNKLSESKVHAYRVQSKIEDIMSSYDIRRLNTSQTDYRALHQLMEDIRSRNQEIIYVMVMETNGLVVLHTDRHREGIILNDAVSLNAAAADRPLIQSGLLETAEFTADGFDIAIPIFYDTSRVGVLRLGVSSALIRDSLTSEIQGLMRKHSIVFLVILGAVIALFLYMVNQINRLRELQKRVSANEKLAYIGSISGSLAHEIKNPLNAINLNIQLLEEDLREETIDRDEAMGTCHVISDEVQRLNELLNDFLIYSRMHSPRLRHESITKTMGAVVELFRKTCMEKNIQLVLEKTSSRSDTISMDRNQIRQVLTNIIKNSIEALEKRSGGIITIAHSINRKRHHVIVIDDNGPGISPKDREKVYDLFYSTKKEGTGLGLPIAKNIVEAHGGSLEIRSILGRGTTVTITLPDIPT